MRRQVASTKKARLNASAKMVTKATESQTAVSTYYLWWLRGRTGGWGGGFCHHSTASALCSVLRVFYWQYIFLIPERAAGAS